MRSIAVDYATLRAAHSILYRNARVNKPRMSDATNEDISISCLGSVIENILLFDRITVAGIPHVFSKQLSSAFGPAVEHISIPYELCDQIEKDALKWTQGMSDVFFALDCMNLQVAVLPDISSRVDLAAWFSGDGPSGGGSFDEKFPRAETEGANVHHTLAVRKQIRAISEGARRNSIVRDGNYKGETLGRLDIRRAEELITNVYWVLFRSRCHEVISRVTGQNYEPHPARSRATALSRASDLKVAIFRSEPLSQNPYIRALDLAYRRGQKVMLRNTPEHRLQA